MNDTKRILKEDLYQQLAQKAAQLSGKPLARDERNTPVATVSKPLDTSHEVLTAGDATAMAEVVLPVEHDLTVIAETAKIVAQRRHQQQKPFNNNMPHRSVSSANPAVPTRFRVYTSAHVTRQHQPYQGDQPQQQCPKKENTDRWHFGLFHSIVRRNVWNFRHRSRSTGIYRCTAAVAVAAATTTTTTKSTVPTPGKREKQPKARSAFG